MSLLPLVSICSFSQPGGLCTTGLFHVGAIAHSGALGGEVEDASPASLTFFATLPPFSR